MEPSFDAPLTLSYARRPGLWRRWWVLIAVALVLSAAGYWGMRAYAPHFAEYQNQRRQDAAVPPAGAIIYSEEPADLNTLPGVIGYTTRDTPGPMIYSGPSIPRVRAVWREGVTWQQTMGGYPVWVPEWRELTPCGRYRARGGAERMIYLQSGPSAGYHDGDRDVLLPGCRVASVVTPWPGPPMRSVGNGFGAIELAPNERVVLYAPQPDSHDASHFTLEYAIDGQHGSIDGWLLPNDSVAFRLASGPATTRPSRGYLLAKP